MKKKIVNIVVDLVLYYLVALVVSMIFKQLGWINGNIYLYSLSITIGWGIAKLIISLFKR